MGHRALVAYEQPDGRLDVRYSHWGGDGLALGSAITAETAFADGAVDPSPVAESITRERLLREVVDPCIYEALYVVDPDDGTDAFRVCWLGWADGSEAGRGVLVESTPRIDDREFDVWFRATKTALADIVEMGRLSPRAARAYLEAWVCEEYDGTPYEYEGVRRADT